MGVEVVTRLSPESCQRMADGKAVDVLFKLMRQCNRSMPHMDLLKYALCILLNLSKVLRSLSVTLYHSHISIDICINWCCVAVTDNLAFDVEIFVS